MVSRKEKITHPDGCTTRMRYISIEQGFDFRIKVLNDEIAFYFGEWG
jgi:hypothetical protein